MCLCERFQCWNCQLEYGYDDAPRGPSRLCDGCRNSGVLDVLVKWQHESVGVN